MRQLSRAVADVCAAETVPDLAGALQAGVARLGFQSYNLSFRKRDRHEFMSDPTMTSWSAADLARYLSDGWADRDPLLMLASRPGAPLAWHPALWKASRAHAGYGEYIASTGLVGGVTAPLDQREGELSAITALSFTGVPKGRDHAEAIQILGRAAVMRAAVLGIAGADVPHRGRLASLSPQQMEILRWAAAGKSNADIAAILGVSRRAVDYHMSQILLKLGVGSRAQAAAIYACGR